VRRRAIAAGDAAPAAAPPAPSTAAAPSAPAARDREHERAPETEVTAR
jgi:hypothetical protein